MMRHLRPSRPTVLAAVAALLVALLPGSAAVAETVSPEPAQPTVVNPQPGEIVGDDVRFQVTGNADFYSVQIDDHWWDLGTVRDNQPKALSWQVRAGDYVLKVMPCYYGAAGDEATCHPQKATTVPVRYLPLRVRVRGGQIGKISPNGDGVKDSTAFPYTVEGTDGTSFDTQLSWWIEKDRELIRGPFPVGKTVDGEHTFVWDGKTPEGEVMADGQYFIEMTARRTIGDEVSEYRGNGHLISVDTAPPPITHVTLSEPSVYPVRDGYRDSLTVRYTSEGQGRLSIRNSSGAVIRTIGSPADGPSSIRWDGLTTAGRVPAPGRYTATLRVEDDHGNRSSVVRRFAVSAKKLVTKTKTVTRTPAQRVRSHVSHPCSKRARSRYTGGYRIVDSCPDTTKSLHQLEFATSAPLAQSVRSVRISTAGRMRYSGGVLVPGWYSWASNTWRGAGTGGAWTRRPIGATTANRSLGSRTGAGLVRSGDRQVKVVVGMPNYWQGPNDDYDMRSVTITITYQVLQ